MILQFVKLKMYHRTQHALSHLTVFCECAEIGYLNLVILELLCYSPGRISDHLQGPLYVVGFKIVGADTQIQKNKLNLTYHFSLL